MSLVHTNECVERINSALRGSLRALGMYSKFLGSTDMPVVFVFPSPFNSSGIHSEKKIIGARPRQGTDGYLSMV